MGFINSLLGGDPVQQREAELYKEAGDTLLDPQASLFEKGAAIFEAVAYDALTISEEERREMERQQELAKQEQERKELIEEERERQLALRENGNSADLNRDIQLNQDPDNQAIVDLDERDRYQSAIGQFNQSQIEPAGPETIGGVLRASTIAQLEDVKTDILHGSAPQIGDGPESVGSQELSAVQDIEGMITELRADQAEEVIATGGGDAGPEELAQLDLDDRENDSPDVSGAGGLFGSQEQEFDAQLNQGQTVTIGSGTEVALTGSTIHDLTGAPPSTSGSFFVSKETTVTLNHDGTVDFPDGASVTFDGKVEFPDGRSAGWRQNVDPKESVFTLVS